MDTSAIVGYKQIGAFYKILHWAAFYSAKEIAEKLNCTDEEWLALAVDESSRPADSWKYLTGLIDEKVIDERFVKKHQHLFELSYLLVNGHLRYEDCRNAIPTYFTNIKAGQAEEAPLWFKVKYFAKYRLSAINYTTENKKTKFTFNVQGRNNFFGADGVVTSIIIKKSSDVFSISTGSLLQFEIKAGKFYFNGVTHDFDAELSENDMDELSPMLDFIVDTINENVRQVKENARKLADAPHEQSQAILAAIKEKDSGFSPLLAGALGLGVGIAIGSD